MSFIPGLGRAEKENRNHLPSQSQNETPQTVYISPPYCLTNTRDPRGQTTLPQTEIVIFSQQCASPSPLVRDIVLSVPARLRFYFYPQFIKSICLQRRGRSMYIHQLIESTSRSPQWPITPLCQSRRLTPVALWVVPGVSYILDL